MTNSNIGRLFVPVRGNLWRSSKLSCSVNIFPSSRSFLRLYTLILQCQGTIQCLYITPLSRRNLYWPSIHRLLLRCFLIWRNLPGINYSSKVEMEVDACPLWGALYCIQSWRWSSAIDFPKRQGISILCVSNVYSHS